MARQYRISKAYMLDWNLVVMSQTYQFNVKPHWRWAKYSGGVGWVYRR